MNGECGKFININEVYKNYFHIYFNDNKKKEIKNTSLYKDDNVSKISIIIDYQIKSFLEFFIIVDVLNPLNLKNFTEIM